MLDFLKFELGPERLDESPIADRRREVAEGVYFGYRVLTDAFRLDEEADDRPYTGETRQTVPYVADASDLSSGRVAPEKPALPEADAPTIDAARAQVEAALGSANPLFEAK